MSYVPHKERLICQISFVQVGINVTSKTALLSHTIQLYSKETLQSMMT